VKKKVLFLVKPIIYIFRCLAAGGNIEKISSGNIEIRLKTKKRILGQATGEIEVVANFKIKI